MARVVDYLLFTPVSPPTAAVLGEYLRSACSETHRRPASGQPQRRGAFRAARRSGCAGRSRPGAAQSTVLTPKLRSGPAHRRVLSRRPGMTEGVSKGWGGGLLRAIGQPPTSVRPECVTRRAQGDRVGVRNPRPATTRCDLSSRRFRRRTGQPPGPRMGNVWPWTGDCRGLDGAPVTPRAHKRLAPPALSSPATACWNPAPHRRARTRAARRT